MKKSVSAERRQAYERLGKIQATLNEIVLGKPTQLNIAISCILAQGHLLIEGLPGEGKTTLAHSLAAVFGLDYRRIQFTNDLLPSDILGVSIFSKEQESFQFHQGPIFTQLLLADEINRATAKSQSALLEAMEEKQVTIEGHTHALPSPFYVIATQNPHDQIGTYPLPESQLDRFLLRLQLGYASREAERALLIGEERQVLITELSAVVDLHELNQLQRLSQQQYCSSALLDYLQDIIEFTRSTDQFKSGLSTRAAQGLLKAAKAYSFLQQRDHVLPDDIQVLLGAIADHRLTLKITEQESAGEVIRHHVPTC